MEIVGGAYSFDRRDLREFGNVLPAGDTGANHLAVEYYVADAALAAVAAPLCARHLQLVAKNGEKRDLGFANYAPRYAVDGKILDMIAGLDLCLCHFLCH